MAARSKTWRGYEPVGQDDGGEAKPRPHCAVRLVDLLDGEELRAERKADAAATKSAAPTARQRRADSTPFDDLGKQKPHAASIPFDDLGKQKPHADSTPCDDPSVKKLRTDVKPSPCPSQKGRVLNHGSEPPVHVSERSPIRQTEACFSEAKKMDVPDGYAVLSIRPDGAGEMVEVLLSVPCATGDRSECLKLYLTVEQYADLDPHVGPITHKEAEVITEMGRLCHAIRRGMGLLQYGDCSARRLAYKLSVKGIDRETADAAVAYLSEKGYIREEDTAGRRAEQGVGKFWGARRIREDLRARGFSSEAVEEAMEALAEADFVGNCASLIRKKYGSVPAERVPRQKMMAALLRLGYEPDEIREAMRRVGIKENV